MKNEKLLKVLLAPHLSEKSVSASRLYVFKVLPSATKLEVKKAVESQFNVSVKSVATLHIKGKTTRFKQVRGRQASWKKAYVTLAEGNQIDMTVGGE